MQPRSTSRIADSFASRLENSLRRLSREHLTLGIILVVLGVFAFQISPWLSWFTIGVGVVLLTWNARIRGTYRGWLYFLAIIPVLHWFNSLNEYLFHEDVVSGTVLSRDSAPPLESAYALIFALAAIAGLILVIRHRPSTRVIQAAAGSAAKASAQPAWSNIPTRTFADVGGLEEAKRRIAAVVNNRLHPERYRQHGVEQNGILLYGPRGTGKTLLAEAVAGEFRMNYWYVRPTALMQRWIGSSEANIRSAFEQAFAHRPVVFFLDEIDSIGAQRQELSRTSDPGGAGKAYNAVVTELMQCIDHYLQLLNKCLGPIPLDSALTANDLVRRLRGIAPAELAAVVGTAKRMAMNRMKGPDQSLPPLNWKDFEAALARNHPSF